MSKRADGKDREIGSQVRQRRQSRGMTQTSLGAAIGVTFQQVQKYERGANRISGSRLTKIADVLGCSVADIFAETSGVPAAEGTDSTAALRLMRILHRLRPDQRAALVAIAESMLPSSES